MLMKKEEMLENLNALLEYIESDWDEADPDTIAWGGALSAAIGFLKANDNVVGTLTLHGKEYVVSGAE
jgi:hypothetical protein